MKIPLVPLTLPPLPYSYDAFEPVISGDAMQIHYEGHHRGYVTAFNNLLEKFNRGARLGEEVSPLA
jgi:Fe-Mn family superoxide dismutase